MLLRAVLVGRGPWGNLYEFCVAFAFGITAGYLYLRPPLPAPLARFLPHRRGALPGRLRVHPAAGHQPARAGARQSAAADHPRGHGDDQLRHLRPVSFGAAVGYLVQGPKDRVAWLPPHKVLDEVAYRAVIIGFPIFATLIILGSWWASIAWGRYWGWDPKETSALVTWLIYAVYLHARTATRLGRPAGGADPGHRLRRRALHLLRQPLFCGLHSYSGLD